MFEEKKDRERFPWDFIKVATPKARLLRLWRKLKDRIKEGA